MILAEIRVADRDALIAAGVEYAVHHCRMTLGETTAMKNTIQSRAREIGLSLEELNREVVERFSDAVRLERR